VCETISCVLPVAKRRYLRHFSAPSVKPRKAPTTCCLTPVPTLPFYLIEAGIFGGFALVYGCSVRLSMPDHISFYMTRPYSRKVHVPRDYIYHNVSYHIISEVSRLELINCTGDRRRLDRGLEKASKDRRPVSVNNITNIC